MSTCQMDAARRQLYIAIFLSVDEKHSGDHHHFPKIAGDVLMLRFASMSCRCISTTTLLLLTARAHSDWNDSVCAVLCVAYAHSDVSKSGTLQASTLTT